MPEETTTILTGQNDTDPGQGGDGDGGNASDWRAGLPEGLRGNEVFKEMNDVGTLAQGYLDLQGRLPQVPGDAAAYELTVPEGMTLDQAMQDGFRKAALEAGLTVDQARKLNDWWNGHTAAQAQELKAAREKGVEQLKQEWKGDDFARNLETAKKAVNKFGGDSFKTFLNESGLGDAPEVIRVFHAIGLAISEDVSPQGNPNPSNTEMERTLGGTPLLSFPSMDK